MHLRPPSIAPGVSSALWGIGLAVFIFLGLVGIGVGKGESFIVAAVSGAAIFLYVRLYGEEAYRR